MADVKYKIEIDGAGAVTSVEKLTDAEKELDKQTDELSDSLKGSGQGFSAFEKGVIVLNQGIQLASAAFTGLISAAKLLPDAINRGAEVNDMADAFKSLTEKAGGTADALEKDLSNALGGTVAKFDLMKQANELLLGGLKPEEIVDVAEAARSLGEATGVNATEGMNLLADSLLRGNDKALKALGIVVDLKAEEEKYAAQLRIKTADLTEDQRVLIARNAVLDAARQKTAELGSVTNDAGDSLAAISAALQDQFDAFTSSIANNQALNEAMISLAATIRNTDFTPLFKGIGRMIELAADATTAMIKFAKAIPQALQKAVDPETFKVIDEEFLDIVDLLAKDTPEATKKAIQSFDLLSRTLDELGDVYRGAVSEDFETIKTQLDDQAVKFGLVADKVNEVAPPVKNLGFEVKATAAQMKIANDIAAEAAKKNSEVKDSVTDLKKELPIFGPGNDAGMSKFIQETQKAESAVGGLAGALLGLNSDFGEFDSGGFLSGLENIGADLLSGFLKGDHFGEEEGKQLGAQLGKDLAQSLHLGPIGEALGSFLGESAAGAIHDAFSGGGNADTEARKELDKFFSELFSAERLQLLINGELRDLSDLDFGGSDAFNEEGWASLFDGLPDAAREAFEGAGQAFNILLETGQDIGGQLASVFANNVGGSLNNLQILIQSTGKSMQELEGAIVTGALRGELSFLQAQSALEGLQTVMQKGIPDAVGAVELAFQNLQDAGVKGGRVSIDALRDLASEAKELGKKTLPELEESLRASGKFTAESIQAIMNALSQYGIQSLDDLENVSDQTAIAILANLEANKFPFKQTLEDIDELNQAIKDIPSNVVKNLTFNVKTNLDTNTQNFAAAGGFKSAGFPAPGPA